MATYPPNEMAKYADLLVNAIRNDGDSMGEQCADATRAIAQRLVDLEELERVGWLVELAATLALALNKIDRELQERRLSCSPFN